MEFSYNFSNSYYIYLNRKRRFCNFSCFDGVNIVDFVKIYNNNDGLIFTQQLNAIINHYLKVKSRFWKLEENKYFLINQKLSVQVSSKKSAKKDDQTHY